MESAQNIKQLQKEIQDQKLIVQNLQEQYKTHTDKRKKEAKNCKKKIEDAEFLLKVQNTLLQRKQEEINKEKIEQLKNYNFEEAQKARQNTQSLEKAKMFIDKEINLQQKIFDNEGDIYRFFLNQTDILKQYITKKAFIIVYYLSGSSENVIQKITALKIDDQLMRNLIQINDLDIIPWSLTTGSDADSALCGIKHAYKIQIVQELDIQDLQDDSHIKFKHLKGEYFNYYNLNEYIDLSDLQIFHESEKELFLKENKEHCFIYALRKSQQFQKEEVDSIKTIMRQQGCFEKSKIKDLKINKDIELQHVNQIDDKENKTLYFNKNKTKFEYSKKGIDNENCLKIGIYKNHFFINKTFDISPFWVKNYNKYKGDQKFTQNKQINEASLQNSKLYFRQKSGKAQQISSVDLLKIMFEQNMFKEIEEFNDFNEDITINNEIENMNVILDTEQQQFSQVDKQSKQYDEVFSADFEAFVQDSQGKNIPHKEFMLCYQSENDSSKKGCVIHIQQFLSKIISDIFRNKENKERKQFNFLIKFYNLTYDQQFITQSDYNITNLIRNDGRIVRFTINQFIKNSGQTFKFDIIDNLLMYNCPLSELPEMFLSKEQQKECYKELFPYNYYNEERYKNDIGSIQEAFEVLKTQYKNRDATIEQFKEAIIRSGALLDDKQFSMYQYAKYYCEKDVDIQVKCNNAFRKMLLESFGLDSNNFLTISSLSIQYQKNQGAFDNVCQMSRRLRKYLQQFQVGGRTMTAMNAKWKIEDKISDFDAVSLYPSAMSRLYYPSGEAKVLSKELIEFYNIRENLFKIQENKESIDQNSLFLTVKLNKSNTFKNRMFPILSQLVDGIRIFDNNLDLSKPFYLTHISLQDAVQFQGYNYEILSGVYYTERNYQIQQIIRTMFEERINAKKNKNPIQIIYKLMMNSSYGKLIEGLHNKQTELVNNCFDQNEITQQGMKQLFKRFDSNPQFFQIGSKMLIETQKSICDDFNFGHCGVFVLDYSKRIMNEMISLAEDNQLNIYYQDTDSIHIKQNQIEILSKKYNKAYNRQLIGKNMGQFHSDFDSKKGDALYSKKLIALGKKVYIDVLVVQTKEGKIVEDYHIRCKGVSSLTIVNKCLNENITPEQLYEKLYNEEEISFNMADTQVIMNKNNKNLNSLTYINEENFIRKVSFHNKEKQQYLF